MSQVQSQIEVARGLLAVSPPKVGPVRLLGATALAATAAVLLAGVMVLGPGVAIEDPSVAAPALTGG